MNSDELAAPASRGSEDALTGVRPGCLLAGGSFALGVLSVIVVAIMLMQRGAGIVDLGLPARYVPNAVVYRSTDGLFVVRPGEGAVVAFSDVDPHNPPGQRSCRVTFRPDLSAGGDPGRFFDICTGSMYDLSGHGLSGDGLDLRPVRVEQTENGRLRALLRE